MQPKNEIKLKFIKQMNNKKINNMNLKAKLKLKLKNHSVFTVNVNRYVC